MKIQKTALIAGFILLTAACAPIDGTRVSSTQDLVIPFEDIATFVNNKTKPFKVKLTVSGSSGSYVIVDDKKPNPKCDKDYAQEKLRKACFVAEEHETVILTFDLHKNWDGARWRVTTFKICAGNTEADKDTCSLSPDQQADFLVEANGDLLPVPSDGTVDLTGVSGELRTFNVRDYNFTSGVFVYQIIACKEGTTSGANNCAVMDPGGINKGRGRG